MKEVKGKLPEDRVTLFEKGAAAYAKKLIANFKDYEFVGLFFDLAVPHNWQTGSSTRENPWTLMEWSRFSITEWVARVDYESLLLTLFLFSRRTEPLVSSCLADLFPLLCWPFTFLVAYFTFWKDGLKEVKL